MPSRFAIRSWLISSLFVAAIAWSSACSDSKPPTTPTPTPPPPTPNAEPVIVSLTAGGPRVDADADLTLTAVVQDAETPLDQLTYQWSSTPIGGDFIGTGGFSRWRAPLAQKTPRLYSHKLTGD